MKKNNENLALIAKRVEEIVAEYNEKGTITDYVGKRREINLAVIEAAVGIEFKEAKKGGYTGKLAEKPSNQDLLNIQLQLNRLFDIESTMTNNDQDAIPGPNYVAISKDAKIQDIYNGLIGDYGLINRNVGCGDVIALAAVGDTLRKKCFKRNAIIIGSIVLVAAAGGTVAYFIVKNNKKDEVVTSTDELPEPEIVDLDDGNIVDLDDEIVNLDNEVIDLTA